MSDEDVVVAGFVVADAIVLVPFEYFALDWERNAEGRSGKVPFVDIVSIL